MNTIERRLIELNEALLNLYVSNSSTTSTIEDSTIDSIVNSDVNIVSINCGQNNNESESCSPGRIVSYRPTEELQEYVYNLENDTLYIGVNNPFDETKIVLPQDGSIGCQIKIIKLEMGPPIGNKKVIVVPFDTDTQQIDGKGSYTLKTPYGVVSLVYNQGNWFIV